MALHSAPGHPTGLECQHFIIAACQPPLALFDQLRREAPVAVTGHLKVQPSRLGVHGFLALAVAAVVPLIPWAGMRGIPERRRQLRFSCPLHDPLRQLFQQAVLAEDILWIGILLQQFVSQGFLFLGDTGHLILLRLSGKITSDTVNCTPSIPATSG
jgi:hypothetical protein